MRRLYHSGLASWEHLSTPAIVRTVCCGKTQPPLHLAKRGASGRSCVKGMNILVVDNLISARRDFVEPHHCELLFPSVLEIASRLGPFFPPKLRCQPLCPRLVARGQHKQRRTGVETEIGKATGENGAHLFEFSLNAAGIPLAAVTEHPEVRATDL